MNAVARGTEVLFFECRAQVWNDAQIEASTEHACNGGCCILVASVDHGQLILTTETRTWLGWRDEFCKFHHLLVIAAIGATREEHHVWAQFADSLDLLVRFAIVIRSDRVHDDRTSAECCALRTFSGHLPHHTGHHHLQATASG